MARPRAVGAASRSVRPPVPKQLDRKVRAARRVGERPPPRYKPTTVGYVGPAMGPRYGTFRVYLRGPTQRVSDKTVTTQRYLAWMAYRGLCSREDLLGCAIAAVITANGRQLAFHAFDDPAPVDPWNDPRNR